jgi:thymidylate synthase (FAD)
MQEEKLVLGETNKFIPVDKIDLYNDSIGYVELYDASHANESEEQRIWTVTTIASLAYGNESAKNPEALYERMKSIKHESLWEFIRDGYDSCGIDSSMRAQEYLYEHRYSCDIDWHKQNIACFRIKVPIFVARQFMRHRSFSYLEMSRRYTKGSKVPFEFWFPKNFTKDSAHQNDWVQAFNRTYDSIIKQGYETQVASRFLPQTTYTEFYVMGEIDGLTNFFKLRLDSHAQQQIRECAEAMFELLNRHQHNLALRIQNKIDYVK